MNHSCSGGEDSLPPPSDAPESSAAGPAGSTEGTQRAFLMTIAYNGANYFGWQLQPDHVTVQQVLEKTLSKLLKEPRVVVHGSSRTDTGVHALAQRAVIRTVNWNAPADKLPFALNISLPQDIVVREAVEVPLAFNPIKDSTGKRYRYQVYCSRKSDPIQSNTHWWVRRRVSVDAMRAAAHLLEGKHDFTSFQTNGSPRSSTVRTVRSLTVSAAPYMDGQLLTIEIEANGFLYNMVRNIVGTLVQVGVGRKPPEWIMEVIAAQDRSSAGATAPPHGLFLTEVLF
ncbi:tRNA pseudouridine(38-40) synthase TruA [Aureliella helgolandensis]|uniref:tRNA pseudouridine synthase A n=1 Tax=Aureliella helgolandensis TaxID=2527968 RepID=A0A518GFB3_9BACT|nr:tRNA pseudouridine(38-40) synthase TruA [Aureliella helgolandensis]QDV27292.1 tRNA pseudouridine synthase A [Aureliella helgolandensis]